MRIGPVGVAALIAAGLGLWLASGAFFPNGAKPGGGVSDARQVSPEPGPVTVRVRPSHAQQVMRNVVLSGRTAPRRAVDVRAQTAGRVVSIAAERGAMLGQGAPIVRLATDDREQALEEAKASVAQRTLDYKARKKLSDQGLQAKTALAEAKTELEAARSELEQARLEIEHTRIEAPFAGVLETRPVEVGDYVAMGEIVARVVQQDPFIVYGDVAEPDVASIHTGQGGYATLTSGRRLQGTVSYIASEADEATRTFRVELEIPNPRGRFISGASATLELPVREYSAHRVSSALLSLGTDGALGIKAVGPDERVRFHNAEIVKTEGNDLWLAGLPDDLTLITVGQGFVRDGDAVKPIAEVGGRLGSDQADKALADTSP